MLRGIQNGMASGANELFTYGHYEQGDRALPQEPARPARRAGEDAGRRTGGADRIVAIGLSIRAARPRSDPQSARRRGVAVTNGSRARRSRLAVPRTHTCDRRERKSNAVARMVPHGWSNQIGDMIANRSWPRIAPPVCCCRRWPRGRCDLLIFMDARVPPQRRGNAARRCGVSCGSSTDCPRNAAACRRGRTGGVTTVCSRPDRRRDLRAQFEADLPRLTRAWFDDSAEVPSWHA